VEEDCVEELKAIVDRNLADLSNIEQTVIHRRFNWKQAGEPGSDRTNHRGSQNRRQQCPFQ
jgi:hypothetical protein